MPPVAKAGGDDFRKDVEFVTKDDDEQIAAGIVMVPDKADLQHDFAREETIRGFSDQFETFAEAGEAGGGIMHAVWPDSWMDLERNEVLDDATEIGGTEAPAGAWIQEWQIDNAELWDLIQDDIISGYSIGAIQVSWNGPYEQGDDEVSDVEVPDELDEDALLWELDGGIIREVSAVDIPAVPDAQILETKSEAEKRLGDYLGNRDGFIEEALQRGHSEAEAERLWDVLNAAVEVEGSGEPGTDKESMFARAGKAFLSALSGSDDDGQEVASSSAASASRSSTSEAPDRDRDPSAVKEGRTLNQQNEDDLKAVIDAATSIFRDAGMDPGITRFTDREDDSFDLSEHTAREFADPEEDGEEEEDAGDDGDGAGDGDVGTGGPPFESAAGGDTPESGSTDAATDMSDETKENDPEPDAEKGDNEPPEWAASLTETVEQIEKRVDDIESDDPEDEEASLEDAPEWAKDLADKVDGLDERVDAISKQTGTDSQQLGKAEDPEEKDSGFTLDPRKARGGN